VRAEHQMIASGMRALVSALADGSLPRDGDSLHWWAESGGDDGRGIQKV